MEIEIHAAPGGAGTSEPLRTGVPFARGTLQEGANLALQAPDGTSFPTQSEPTERWSDGSVRWALLDFAIPRPGPARLRVIHVPAPVALEPRVSVDESERAVVVETGAARFVVGRAGPVLFESVLVHGQEQIDPSRSALTCRDEADHEIPGTVRSARVESAGPLRATIELEGSFGGTPLRFFARADFFAGSTAVKLAITIRNSRRAAHPGGIWELGDAGSFVFRDLTLAVAARAAPRTAWSAESGQPLGEAAGPVQIYQESSGGENWQSRVHQNRDGVVPMTFRGFRARVADDERFGLRATPRLVAHDGVRGISVSVRSFWENFPKALEIDGGVILARLFPAQFPAIHELQGGEQKTHEIAFVFGEPALTESPEVFRAPSTAAPTAAAFAASGALPYLLPAAENPNGRYAQLLAAAHDRDGFLAKRERSDEYGWRHFGEIPADHEGRDWHGEGTFVSHYNNQYDAVLGALTQFARSGDMRWFRLMDELARHVADIDLYHTTEDRPWYNHGLFWPTVHYVDAGLSTHRTYPRGTSGGGPDNEHNYTTGLRYWWLLTGNPIGREASLDGARRAVAADDGSSTNLRWVDRSPTGFSSKTRMFDYHGPGRGSANTIVALLDAWRITADDAWLSRCDEFVRRTIHPKDDVAALDLLDAENRWSYTVHLQAIGRYLDERAESDRLDRMYTYARESLLSYARWMAEHEQPTLAQREKLEFPTETWAAQDLRKAEVFCFAALHAEGAERARFRERASWFLDRSLESLEEFPTRTFARPLVLLSRFGPMVDWLEAHPHETRPPPAATADFGKPSPFVPQRARAIRRLRDAFLMAALAGAGFALARIFG